MAEPTNHEITNFRLSAHWSAPTALGLVWGILTVFGIRLFKLRPWSAGVAALAAVLGHAASELWHQLGHALAAASTGYPMRGIRLWGIFATSIYPADEPALPAAVHIRRALGGPIASALLTLLLGIRLRRSRRASTPVRWVLWWLFVDNLLVFTLQVFLPLGFNDGATLRQWRTKRPDTRAR